MLSTGGNGVRIDLQEMSEENVTRVLSAYRPRYVPCPYLLYVGSRSTA